MNSIPSTLPSAPLMTRVGPAWKMVVTPSSMASWTSLLAGMSFMSPFGAPLSIQLMIVAI